jgi:hypothetical protein
MAKYTFDITVEYEEDDESLNGIQDETLYDLESLIRDHLERVPGVSDVKADTGIIYENLGGKD